MNESIRCQCPERGEALAPASWYEPEEMKARQHDPHACPGDYDMKLVKRGDEELWLCSCCTGWGDEEIETMAGRIAKLSQVHS